MAHFRYTGPLTGVTLITTGGATSEHMLHPDSTVELPADHPHVATLVALKRLTPIATDAAAATDIDASEAPSPAAALSAAAPRPRGRAARGASTGGAASFSDSIASSDSTEGTIE